MSTAALLLKFTDHHRCNYYLPGLCLWRAWSVQQLTMLCPLVKLRCVTTLFICAI